MRLNSMFEQSSHVFQKRKTAARKSDSFRNFLCDRNVGRIEVNVVCDQRLSRANHSGACGWMKPGFAEVRIAIRVCLNLVSKRLELSAADIFKVCSFGTSSGGFIQVNGNLEPAPNLGADFFRNLHAVEE